MDSILLKLKTDMNDLTGAWTLSIKFGGKRNYTKSIYRI